MTPLPDDRNEASYAYEATFSHPKLRHTRMRLLPDEGKLVLERMRSFFLVGISYLTRMRPVSDGGIGTSYAYEVLAGGCFLAVYAKSSKLASKSLKLGGRGNFRFRAKREEPGAGLMWTYRICKLSL